MNIDTLPVSTDGQAQDQKTRHSGPINILIVDDEPKNLTVLETVLDDPGYRLVRAESADQALLALVAEEFALLILDIRMPGMTGFELAKMIKGRKKTALVPIIFLTAYYNEDQHVLVGYGTGAVDYLHKPVNSAILRSKVAVFAELHRQNRALLFEVTERRRGEEQLREINETLENRVLQRTAELAGINHAVSAAAILAVTDVTGTIEQVNDNVVRISKYSREELIGQDHRLLNSGLHPKEFIRDLWATIANGRVWRNEIRNRAKDGSFYWVDTTIAPILDERGKPVKYIAIGFDISARKLVEEEQKRLELRLRDQHFYTRSLVESNIDALMATDPRGIITDVNKQTEALTGCTRDELIGAPFKNYFTDSGRAEAGINRVLTEGKITNYELTARARDGKQTTVSYNATTFHDRDRKLQGVFAAARDVTELKRYEKTLHQKNVELESSSRTKSEFLAKMSHELRTPLNAIIGFSEVLKDGLMGEMTDKQRGFIGDIFSSGNHLLSLINDILDLSKVEAGTMMLDLESVPVSSLFANSLAIVRDKAATRHIRLGIEAAEELGSFQADARKVKQIAYNLLSNAVKFTVEGGQVTLRAGPVARAEVGRLSGNWAGRTFPLADNEFTEFLKISVTDSGIGISPDGLQQLFKPFSQVDSGLARKYEGTGLGLAMVKLLAELHGGSVAVESEVGKGSCFTVWLPLRAPEEGVLTSVKAPAAPFIEAPAGARTALVVEDDFKSADLIRVQLEAEGFRVLHAASAEAALALAVQQPVSLITLDIMLPNMDGWELLNRLKQMPSLARIPVVIIAIVADHNKGFALGAAGVMQKPISRQELYEALVALGLVPLSQGHTLKVLVVDDDPKAVELIAVSLQGLATTVMRASGGREAIECAQQELPDLIVLDLMMPEVNGFEVVEALKRQPDTAGIPILVVTAKRCTTEERARLNEYVTTIMEKGTFDRDRLTAEVRRAMSGRQLVV